MSTNLQIYATRKVITLQNKESEQIIYFTDMFQTPTKVTYEILNSDDILRSYKEWVYSLGYPDKIVPVFKDYSDYIDYCVNEDDSNKIGTKISNIAIDHIDVLYKWIELCESDGYEIKYCGE